MCFNCGSADHQLRDCRKPRIDGGASFATCFVCQQTGHLSSQCPKSTTGVYPRGGCCKICQSILHLARDCPAGSINADGSSNGQRNNKKIKFDDYEEDVGPVDSTGDALDSYKIDLKEDNDDDDGDDQDDANKPSKRSAGQTKPKRVKF